MWKALQPSRKTEIYYKINYREKKTQKPVAKKSFLVFFLFLFHKQTWKYYTGISILSGHCFLKQYVSRIAECWFLNEADNFQNSLRETVWF